MKPNKPRTRTLHCSICRRTSPAYHVYSKRSHWVKISGVGRLCHDCRQWQCNACGTELDAIEATQHGWAYKPQEFYADFLCDKCQHSEFYNPTDVGVV